MPILSMSLIKQAICARFAASATRLKSCRNDDVLSVLLACFGGGPKEAFCCVCVVFDAEEEVDVFVE